MEGQITENKRVGDTSYSVFHTVLVSVYHIITKSNKTPKIYKCFNIKVNIGNQCLVVKKRKG